MKAPSSPENLRLLLPNPQHARRLKRVLDALLVAVGAILLVVVFNPTSQTTYLQYWRWPAVGAGLLLLLLVGHRLFRYPVVGLRRVVHGMFSPSVLCFLLILPALRLFWVLALDTEHSLPEIFRANWAFLTLVALSAVCLLFQARLSPWIDRQFFLELHQREHVLGEWLDAIKTSHDLPEVARRTIQTINEAWHPQHIGLLFTEAALTDYHFAAEAFNPPAHLPANFPLQALFAKDPLPLQAPLPHFPGLTATENAWLVALQAQALWPLTGSNHRILGLLALGPKQSAQPYTPDELQLIFALARQIAFVSERAPLKVTSEQGAQLRLARLARLEAAQRQRQTTTEEPDVQAQLLVQEHLNDLPQRQEFPARVG